MACWGYGTLAWGVADNLPWDNPEQRLPDGDLAAAKALLDKAGWVEKDGKRSKGGRQARFTLLYPASDNVRQSLAVSIADMVKPLGIQIDIAGKSWDEIYRESTAMPCSLAGARTTSGSLPSVRRQVGRAGIVQRRLLQQPTVTRNLKSPNFPPVLRNRCRTGKTQPGTAQPVLA